MGKNHLDRRGNLQRERPWPVYALVVLNIVGLAWALVVDQQRNIWDLGVVMLDLWITYSLFTGKAWAFTVSFMFASLCAGVFLLAAGIQVFLLEQGIQTGLLWGFLVSALWISLLMNAQTKRFAFAGRKPETEAGDGLPRGSRLR